MEKYVVSRELAEKLKVSGYPQKPQYFYYLDGVLMYNVNKYELSDQMTVAPLSDELLEQMFGILTFTVRGFDNETGAVLIEAVTVRGANYCTVDGRPADALAELWVWCKKYGNVNEL